LLLLLAHKTDQLQRVKEGLSFIVHPILVLVDLPAKAYDWLNENTSGRTTILEENRVLKSKALILKAKLQKLDSIEKENTRLHSLLESSFKIGEQFISASLIDVNLNPNMQQIIIDKGLRFDLHLGQAALNEDGVIGQIIEVRPQTSTILLITDPNHATPVEINRTGLRTIATGNGAKNTLNLPYLPHNTDIKTGDLLITSGLGGVFPKGYPVAIVSTLKSSPGEAFMQAEATSIAKVDSTRELLLVWSNQEPISLIKNPVVNTQPSPVDSDAR
jgi:rod shape-determining protein MreC|tara:strand:+ start:14485 stop:15306 length:822 start_codon:yes stop_codon:yes gene_type:complete